MTIWAISDLHLSSAVDKPMYIFGDHWENHTEKIEKNWRHLVAEDDTVLIAGDISWGISFDQAMPDLQWLENLPGKKILTRGNHDYWWKKIKWMRENLPPSIYPLQNDSVTVEGRTVCGCKGYIIPTMGSETFEEDQKYFLREQGRLKLSLESEKNRKDTIVMIHFPPFIEYNNNLGFLNIIEEYEVNTVVYGHLHASDTKSAFSGMRNGVNYIFTSADGIEFCPVKVE